MVAAWVVLGIGAGLLLLGYLAYLAFERWRVPDFLFLLLLGIAVGPYGLDAVPPAYRDAIDTAAPVFAAVAVAFLLFEGGVRLPLRGMGRPVALILVHTLLVAAWSSAAVWLVLTRGFGVSPVGALVFAAATLGPSASIVLSFAPRLALDDRARSTVVLEGVVGNVLAFLVVAALAQLLAPAAPAGAVPGVGGDLGGIALGAALAVAMAVVAGVAWLGITRRRPGSGALHMATLGLAIAVYAAAEGPLGGHGAVGAFAFGLVLGNRGLVRRALGVPADVRAHDAELARFHGEVTFFIRTFFFVYLGLLFDPGQGALTPVLVAVALTAVFLAARFPTTSLLGRAWGLPRSDVRVVRGTVARGMSDAVVVVYAIQVGLVLPSEAPLLTSALLLTVVVTAVATALLVLLAERARLRAPGEAPAPAPPPAPAAGMSRFDEYPEAPLLRLARAAAEEDAAREPPGRRR